MSQSLLAAIRANIQKAIVGHEAAIDYMLISLICRGHVLLEDVPGVGKTTLVAALAKSLACTFSRIQFTPDVMPSDIVGFSLPDLNTGDFRYQPGAVMRNIVLADEINRTSPKTQSALLQVMQERQVTVDGTTYALPEPFMVLATQNPIEFVGTYPLPEAQLDRFMMRITLGYPTPAQEMEILRRYQSANPLESLPAVVTSEQVVALCAAVDAVTSTHALHEYIAALVTATRNDPDLLLGVSPRGGIALLRAACGCALLMGRDYATPDDVQDMAIPVLAHRLVLKQGARLRERTTESILRDILARTPLPKLRA